MGANHRRRPHSDFLDANLRDGDRVQNVRLARLAPLLAVRFDGHFVGRSYLQTFFIRQRRFDAFQQAAIGALDERAVVVG